MLMRIALEGSKLTGFVPRPCYFRRHYLVTS